MEAVDFESVVQNGQIQLPPEIAGNVPQGEQVRVVIMWKPADADAAWRKAGRQSFEAAYAPEDAVYDKLMDDSASR